MMNMVLLTIQNNMVMLLIPQMILITYIMMAPVASFIMSWMPKVIYKEILWTMSPILLPICVVLILSPIVFAMETSNEESILEIKKMKYTPQPIYFMDIMKMEGMSNPPKLKKLDEMITISSTYLNTSQIQVIEKFPLASEAELRARINTIHTISLPDITQCWLTGSDVYSNMMQTLLMKLDIKEYTKPYLHEANRSSTYPFNVNIVIKSQGHTKLDMIMVSVMEGKEKNFKMTDLFLKWLMVIREVNNPVEMIKGKEGLNFLYLTHSSSTEMDYEMECAKAQLEIFSDAHLMVFTKMFCFTGNKKSFLWNPWWGVSNLKCSSSPQFLSVSAFQKELVQLMKTKFPPVGAGIKVSTKFPPYWKP